MSKRTLTAGSAVVLLGSLLALGVPAGAGASPSGHVNPAGREKLASDPGRAIGYLAAQNAGEGSPRQAEQRYLTAVVRARRIAAATARGAATARRAGLVASSIGSTAWTSLGPHAMGSAGNGVYAPPNSGRVDSLAASSAGKIFAGTAGGGIWASANGGSTWSTDTDHLPTGLAIGALAADPVNSAIVYAGTGETNNCGDCLYGDGVLKSTNSGATWAVENPGSIFTGADFAALIVDSNNDQKLYAATTYGFFISTNGGTSWSHPSGSWTSDDATDVVIAPAATSTGATTIYVAVKGIGVEKSTDGGTSFTAADTGLPAASEFGTTALGIGTKSSAHPSAARTLYAAVQLNGATNPANGGDVEMFKTVNGGSSWSQLTSIPAYTNQSYAYGSGTADQAWYDNALAVDPANPGHVLAGGISLITSSNGGTSWTNVNGGNFFSGHNVLHPDQHAILFTTGGKVLIGNDGGLYDLSGTTVSDLNSDIDSGQYYEDVAVYNNGAQVLGGLQDNGTTQYTGKASTWAEVIAGDGGYNAINPLDSNEQFGEADQELYLTTGDWASGTSVITPPQLHQGKLPKYPGGPDPALPANFVPPMTIVPNSSSIDNPTVFYGANELYMTKNPDTSPPTWTAITNSASSNISAIALAPSNPAVMYVGFDNGTLQVLTNATSATPTFTTISTSPADWVTHIAVSPTNAANIAVSYSDSNSHSVSFPPMVETGVVTLTGTPAATFTDITGNLPSGVSSNSVVYDGSDLVVATEVGTFYTASPNGSATTWSSAGTGLPNVQVLGLTEDAAGNLYAATHGRGVWELHAGGTWAKAQNVAGLAALDTGGGSEISSMSCASPGTCSAGGFYTAYNGNNIIQPFVVDETSGTWGTAEEVPGIAALNTGGGSEISSVSCASAGNCSAGGYYTDSSSSQQAFVVDETNGTWGTAEEVPGIAALDAGGKSQISSVSCASAGNCSAGGYYTDSSGSQQAFVVGETNGTWGTAEEVAAALNTGGFAQINSVSCASAGNCSAGGFYAGGAFLVDEVNGTWDTAEQVPGSAALDTGGFAQISSVSCASAGNCSAGGYYTDSSLQHHAFVVGETNGTWGTAEEVPGSSALNTGRDAAINSVSCPSAGNCSAGGHYTNSKGLYQALVVDETNGTWGTAEEVPGSAALNKGGRAEILSMSCPSPGNCSAGGYVDSYYPLVAGEVNGAWGTAEKVPGMAKISPFGEAIVGSVSCASAGNCSAGGFYYTSSSEEAFLVNQKAT